MFTFVMHAKQNEVHTKLALLARFTKINGSLVTCNYVIILWAN